MDKVKNMLIQYVTSSSDVATLIMKFVGQDICIINCFPAGRYVCHCTKCTRHHKRVTNRPLLPSPWTSFNDLDLHDKIDQNRLLRLKKDMRGAEIFFKERPPDTFITSNNSVITYREPAWAPLFGI